MNRPGHGSSGSEQRVLRPAGLDSSDLEAIGTG